VKRRFASGVEELTESLGRNDERSTGTGTTCLETGVECDVAGLRFAIVEKFHRPAVISEIRFPPDT